jgi:PPOX class probable FMN-dependent enzyme
MDAPFPHVLTTEEELGELYRAPHRAVKAKIVPALDASARDFIGLSPFVLVGTADADGSCDVSPRGGPPGFVQVLDDNRLAIPDLNGNNLLDTIRNVVSGGRVGLLFTVPGKDETLRVNGRAWVTVDDEILDGFTELRRPKCAIGVEVAQVYIHCAKAFRRGRVWDPHSWAELAAAPSAARMLICQVGLDMTVEDLERSLEEGYAVGLAEDRPVPS